MTTTKANTLMTAAATAVIALVSLTSLGGWTEPSGDVGLPAGRAVSHRVVHRTIEIDGLEGTSPSKKTAIGSPI